MKARRSILSLFAIIFTISMLVTPTTSPHVQEILGKPLISGDHVSVFVQNTHDFTQDEIQLLGDLGAVTSVDGQIAVLHTQSSHLFEIARLPFVIRTERPHILTIALDESVPDVGGPEVWNEVKDPNGRNVTGRGVIIGFVDTGIDTTHPDFRFPNGSTKILYVWDQTTLGRPPAGFGYGFECTSADVNTGRCPEVDTFGHGTHVAGIAASSGMATRNYTGVAPGASIIFVKSGFEVCNGQSWSFGTTELLDGVNYLVRKANQLRMRLVINLSLGGNIGAHDGTDSLEVALDAVVKAGTPVVVAAGNEARDNAHARGRLRQGGNVTIQLEAQQTTIDLEVDIWYSKLDRISATLRDPKGGTYPVPTNPGGTNGAFGNITTLRSTSASGNELYLEVNSSVNLPTKGWSVTLNADQINSQGWWDAWTDAVTCTYPGAFFTPGTGYDIDPTDTVGIPGNAKYVVTVGAYITKTFWKGMDDQTYGRKDIAPGGIASYSSLGPTRDGRIKPDVVAPGSVIASARSRAIASANSDPDPFHRMLAGTSMATPHVAGIVALMLQYSPSIKSTDIPAILRQTARVDANTGVIPSGSPTWGFGKADARTATGLFRLTVVAATLPEGVSVPILVDGRSDVQIADGSWSSLYFLKGTTHMVSFPGETVGTQGTRYEIRNSSLEVSANSMASMNYSVQYFLNANSPFTPVSGSGWYDANATATVRAPDYVPASGVLGYLGVGYSLAYWVNDKNQVAANSVIMDAPKTLTAVYVFKFPLEATLAVLIIVAAVLSAIVVIARKRLC